MSRPRSDFRPAPSPGRTRALAHDDDIPPRRRAVEGLYRALSRLAREMARDWRHCGKAACLRSRRCRGRACDNWIVTRKGAPR